MGVPALGPFRETTDAEYRVNQRMHIPNESKKLKRVASIAVDLE